MILSVHPGIFLPPFPLKEPGLIFVPRPKFMGLYPFLLYSSMFNCGSEIIQLGLSYWTLFGWQLHRMITVTITCHLKNLLLSNKRLLNLFPVKLNSFVMLLCCTNWVCFVRACRGMSLASIFKKRLEAWNPLCPVILKSYLYKTKSVCSPCCCILPRVKMM